MCLSEHFNEEQFLQKLVSRAPMRGEDYLLTGKEGLFLKELKKGDD